MKAKDIAKNHQIDLAVFERWLTQSEYKHKTGFMGGLEVDDSHNVEEMVGRFKQYQIEEQDRVSREHAAQERAAELERQAQNRKDAALKSMLITSGFSFEGHSITKYAGYISGDGVVQVDRGRNGIFGRATNVGESLMSSLGAIRQNALAGLKEAAYAEGCNAVIGVDFDYLTLDPETVNANGGTLYMPYVFGVTANGTAVLIEKDAASMRG